MKAFFTSCFSALIVGSAAMAAGAARADVMDIAAQTSVLRATALVEAEAAQGLAWKVGDTASYSIEMGGFIKGTSVMSVAQDTGDGYWVNQDLDMGFVGKHKVEILFNKADGQVKQIKMDGQNQSLPDASKMEVVEMKEATVTVPAGTFKAIYAKLRDKDKGDITEAWVNPKEVPISGAIKSLSQAQFGQVKQELTSYKRAN